MKRKIETKSQAFGRTVAEVSDGRWRISNGSWKQDWRPPARIASAIKFYQWLVDRRPESQGYKDDLAAVQWVQGEMIGG